MTDQRFRLDQARTIVEPWATSPTEPEPHRVDVCIAASDLRAAVDALHQARWGFLAAITGLDHGPADGRIEALYHFTEGPVVFTLRVTLDRTQPAVPSVCEYIPAASFYERELIEMLGITVMGTPNTDRLFLPDDWPAGVFPLRKDFDPAAVDSPQPETTP